MVKRNKTSQYTIIGKSVRGASHKRVGKACQDSYKTVAAGGAVILAAADGHGSESCPFSKTGSVIAVNVFCKLLKDYYNSYTGNIDALITLLSREGDTTIARAIAIEWKRRVEKAHRIRGRKFLKTQNGETDKPGIWRQYGSTLLGLMVTPSFYFAFQLGDGDIVLVNKTEAKYPMQTEKILGVETQSLSRADAWEKVITIVRQLPQDDSQYAFIMATDGFANSYPNEESFLSTCVDYYAAIREHGADAVAANLKAWLNETSENGSGDDITVLICCNQ